jgi:hypothetical protein
MLGHLLDLILFSCFVSRSFAFSSFGFVFLVSQSLWCQHQLFWDWQFFQFICVAEALFPCFCFLFLTKWLALLPFASAPSIFWVIWWIWFFSSALFLVCSSGYSCFFVSPLLDMTSCSALHLHPKRRIWIKSVVAIVIHPLWRAHSAEKVMPDSRIESIVLPVREFLPRFHRCAPECTVLPIVVVFVDDSLNLFWITEAMAEWSADRQSLGDNSEREVCLAIFSRSSKMRSFWARSKSDTQQNPFSMHAQKVFSCKVHRKNR